MCALEPAQIHGLAKYTLQWRAESTIARDAFLKAVQTLFTQTHFLQRDKLFHLHNIKSLKTARYYLGTLSPSAISNGLQPVTFLGGQTSSLLDG